MGEYQTQVEDYTFNWGYYDDETGLCEGAVRTLPLFPTATDGWLTRLQQVLIVLALNSSM